MAAVTRLADWYALECATPSDIYEHLPTFYALAQDATTVIELGTRSGVSTIAWLYGLEGHGHLWSVDIDPKPEIGTHAHWTFIQGDDCSGEVFAQLPADVDVVFIDTSHEYAHTLRELNLYRWLLKPGGKLVLHDTELPHPEFVVGKAFPVKRAIGDFCAAEGLEWENDPRCWGLGTITLP